VDVVGEGEDVVDVETGVDEVEGALGTENGDDIGGGGDILGLVGVDGGEGGETH
jgi:hypothetical protein